MGPRQKELFSETRQEGTRSNEAARENFWILIHGVHTWPEDWVLGLDFSWSLDVCVLLREIPI